MPNIGTIFGTVPYGTSFYGNPIGATAGLPIYSAAPFVANTQGYQKVLLTWARPTNGVTLRMVRNGRGDPADENDGLVLLEQSLTGNALFVDTTIEPSDSGQIYYYALWNQDASNNWWWAGSAQTMIPGTYGYGARMFTLLPQWYQDIDDQFVFGN
jgi:hypothetical protein